MKYQNPSSLGTDEFRANENEKIKQQIINKLIKLIEFIDISENESPKKVANIVGKILNFNEQQKRRGLEILTTKQTLQRLQIALAQIKPVTYLKTYLLKPVESYVLYIKQNKSRNIYIYIYIYIYISV